MSKNLTARDYEILQKIKEYEPISTTQISELFFKGRKASAYKVITRLYQNGKIKRMRRTTGSINSEYAYFVREPKKGNVRHHLLLLDFIVDMKSKYGFQWVEIEKEYSSIRPDATLMTEKGLILLEVEISNKGFDYMKYEQFVRSGEDRKYFTQMPIVCIYTDKNPNIPDNTLTKFWWTKIP